MSDKRVTLLAAAIAGVILFHHGWLLNPSELDILVVRRALGEAPVAGELYMETLTRGPYFIVDYLLAALLKVLGLAGHWQPALSVLRALACWTGMLGLFRLLRRLTGSDAAAALGLLFFAADLSLFPLGNGEMINNRLPYFLALPAVFWSLDMYLSDRRGLANALAALAICFHIVPGIYLIPFYFLNDVYELATHPAPSRAGAFAARWAGFALFCAVFIGWVGGGGLPPSRDCYLSAARFFAGRISLRVAANRGDLIASAEGAALLAAFGGFKKLHRGDILARVSLLSVAGCVVSTLVEGADPSPWMMPFWGLVVKVCWLRSLWFVNLFAIAAAAAGVRALVEDEKKQFPAAVLLAAALFMRKDYVARAAGLAALALPASFFQAPFWLGLAACGGANLLWNLEKARLGPWAVRFLPLRGGVFALSAFSPSFLIVILATALAAAAGLTRSGRRAYLGILTTLCLAVTLALNAGGFFAQAWQTPGWRLAADWIREKTPAESVWLTPLYLDPTPFLSDARRAVYAAADYYGVITVAPGHSSLLARRLEDYGVDFSRNRTYWEVNDELERADRGLSVERMKELTKGVPSAYALRFAGQPLSGLPEAYRNPEFIVYRLR